MSEAATMPRERRALVVYESMFGNTEAVARAVAAGLATAMPVRVEDVNEAPTDLSGYDLLVAGGPTHAFGMSRHRTRVSSEAQGARPEAASGEGVREWLAKATAAGRLSAAAFDTRVRKPRLPGSAAKGVRRLMHRRGLAIVRRPISFWVDGTSGPLVDGELDRAEEWGRELATAVQGFAGTRHSSSVPRG